MNTLDVAIPADLNIAENNYNQKFEKFQIVEKAVEKPTPVEI